MGGEVIRMNQKARNEKAPLISEAFKFVVQIDEDELNQLIDDLEDWNDILEKSVPYFKPPEL